MKYIQHVGTNDISKDDLHGFDYLKGVQRDLGSYVDHAYLKLRLVSRAFNRAVARVYFQHEFLTFHAFGDAGMYETGIYVWPNSVQKINDFILQGELLPRVLRNLRLDLSKSDNFYTKERKGWMIPDSAKDFSDDKKKLLAFLRVLPSALARLDRLECLWVDFNERWQSEFGGNNDWAPQLDLTAVDEFRKSFCTLFSPSYPHRFRFLTELRLILPCTYDFAALNNVMSDEATGRLQHLYLEYIDATGPGGDNEYTRWAEDEEGDMGDDDCPLSNLQEQYPNENYMDDICSLVGRCSNLVSLGLHATHYLDLDELDWKPTEAGLKNLYIYRAKVSFKTLKQLLSAADGESPNIIAIKLSYVELLDHTWSEIFDHIMRADAIKLFSIDNLNYAHRGDSAHLREFNSRIWENASTIWTDNSADLLRLQNLVKKVLDGGGLVGKYVEDEIEEAGYDPRYPDGIKVLSQW